MLLCKAKCESCANMIITSTWRHVTLFLVCCSRCSEIHILSVDREFYISFIAIIYYIFCISFIEMYVLCFIICFIICFITLLYVIDESILILLNVVLVLHFFNPISFTNTIYRVSHCAGIHTGHCQLILQINKETLGLITNIYVNSVLLC